MKRQYLFLVALFGLMSCKKENQSNYKEVSAMIFNTKSSASNGCGFLLKVDGTNTVYNPVNLPNLLKTDSQEVIISYNLLQTKCNCAAFPGEIFEQINLNSIRKKDAVKLK